MRSISADAARRGQPPLGDDRDPAAQRLGVGEDVRAEEDRPPLVAQLEDQRAHVAAAERIEARHRLVEEHHLGIVEQRLGEADALQHPLRELAQLQPALGADAEAIEQRGRRASADRPPLIAEQPREVVQQLLGGEVVVEVGILRQVADAPARRRRSPTGRPRISARPAVGKISCISSFSVVVLPAPLGPRKPKTSPVLDLERQARRARGTGAGARSRPRSPW